MKEDIDHQNKEEFTQKFKENLPELLTGLSTAEQRRTFCKETGVYTPAGLPIVVPYGENAAGAVQLARFDLLRKRPDHVLSAAAYLRGIGMTTMADQLLAHFDMDADNPSVIGRPISNTQAYILGKDLSLLPIGATGEICVSGIGLARGYLSRPDETNERFVPHPFRPNERLYMTGDLGRYQSDGSIEFRGRTDHQVKIRGLRIEPQGIHNTATVGERISIQRLIHDSSNR